MEALPASVTDGLTSMVRVKLAKLPLERQQQFLEEYKRKARSTALAVRLVANVWLALRISG